MPEAVLARAERLYPHAVLLVEGGRVAALLEREECPRRLVEEFPGELWAAAPLLLHAHLESYDAPSGGWRRDSFSTWVRELLAWRAAAARLAPTAAAACSLAELAEHGCGFVLSHVGETGARSTRHEEGAELPELWAFPELFAPDPLEAGEVLAELRREAGPGVALHAPYSASEPLARAVFQGCPRVSLHLGEHREERLFLAGGGPLAELFAERRRVGKERGWASPVDWLEEMGGLRPGVLAVHGGDLDAAELARLHRGGVAVVWCPGTHRYFERPRPAFAGPGLPLPALGCDSRASNSVLDPLRELRLARAEIPAPGPQAWWRAVTAAAAALLGREDLGHLEAGAQARFLRLPWREMGGAAAACDALSADPGLRPLVPVARF